MPDEKENGNGYNGREESTPTVRVRSPSEASLMFANMAVAMQSVAEHCKETARLIDIVGDAQREVLRDEIRALLKRVGSLAYEADAIIGDMK